MQAQCDTPIVGVQQLFGRTSQVADDGVPVVEALAARLAVGQHAGGAARAVVALVARHARHALADARAAVTLQRLRALVVTVAC